MNAIPPRGPPRWLERLVEFLLGRRPSAFYVLGDLREEYEVVRSRRSASFSALWYFLHGVRVAARLRVPSRETLGGRGRLSLGDRLHTDVRQSVRFLLRRPGITAAIVTTIALAISASTMAFAVVDGVLIESLPYDSPDRLVALWESNPRGVERNVVSPANYLAWRDELRSVEVMASLMESSATLESDDRPERVGFLQASASYFDVVGAEPLIGRLYTETDDVAGADGVVVLSEQYWHRRFGADPDVLGRTLRLNVGGSLTVVGVLPDRYDFVPDMAFGGVGSRDLWIPQWFGPSTREASGRYLQVIGRLAPGVTAEQAQREATEMAAELAETYPERNSGWGVTVVPLQRDIVGEARTMILVVFGAVCLVLLIACANVANLLLTRASERRGEMAVRAALGAGRRRVVGQLLLESALMSAVGGALGLVLAHRGIAALVATAPDIPRIDTVGVDATVLAYALVATAGTAFLFGLAPALALGGGDPGRSLATRGSSDGRGVHRVRGALVVAQVSLSLMLLVGAGLLVRSLVNRLDVGVGFDPDNVVVTDVQLGAMEDADRAAFFEDFVRLASEVPGVRSAAAITFPPLAGAGSRTTFWPLDRTVPPPGERPGADVRWVHRGYHATMGIPVVAGRTFEIGDAAEAPLVTLVNETGASELWPGESPLGKRIAMPWGDTLRAEVVGVVGDVRHQGPDTEPYPMFYFDHRQFSPFNIMSLVARMVPGADREAVVAGLRGALARLDPSIPPYNIAAMEDLFADAMKQSSLATLSLGVFALMALLLAAIGIYGVMAHATAQRVREIGIRMALGARASTILKMVLRQGMAYVLLAVVLGTLGAFGFTRLLRGLVFGVSPADPLTFVAMGALLALTGLVACWLPARRATAVDPASTIRIE